SYYGTAATISACGGGGGSSASDFCSQLQTMSVKFAGRQDNPTKSLISRAARAAQGLEGSAPTAISGAVKTQADAIAAWRRPAFRRMGWAPALTPLPTTRSTLGPAPTATSPGDQPPAHGAGEGDGPGRHAGAAVLGVCGLAGKRQSAAGGRRRPFLVTWCQCAFENE